MQQIYTHRDEQFEVFTTVFSPQVCRSRARTPHVEAQKVVVVRSFRAGWPEELDLSPGDELNVVFKDDRSWWFGRLPNGDEGYFPAACVASSVQNRVLQSGDSTKPSPGLVRRGSVPVVVATADAPCGCSGGHVTPKLLRKNSLRRALRPESSSAAGEAGPHHGSPSLLHRVLAKSRRKSCPHLPHLPRDRGSVNAAFQPD